MNFQEKLIMNKVQLFSINKRTEKKFSFKEIISENVCGKKNFK